MNSAKVQAESTTNLQGIKIFLGKRGDVVGSSAILPWKCLGPGYFSTGTMMPRMITPWQSRNMMNVGTAAMTSDA